MMYKKKEKQNLENIKNKNFSNRKEDKKLKKQLNHYQKKRN